MRSGELNRLAGSPVRQSDIFRGLASLFLLLWAFTAPAQCRAAGLEVTPVFGYTFGGGFENSVTGEDLNFAEAQSYGLILDLPDRATEGGSYELLYLRQPTRLKGDSSLFSPASRFDVDIDYLHIGGTYDLAGERVNPYVAAGIGLTRMTPERGDAETRFSFSIGGGVKIPLTQHIGLRFEGRGFGTLFNGRGSIFCTNSGDSSSCELQVDGDLLWQFTTFGGIVLRF